MFLLQQPTAETIAKFLASQRESPFSYADLGATRGIVSRDQFRLRGYGLDHNRIHLGNGHACYERAKQAICSWKMFNLGWCTLHPQNAPIAMGTVVAVAVQHLGFWSLNASRIVYTLEDETSGNTQTFGFAYGTVRDHSEIGEERFSVEWNRNDDSVWYDLLAFSHPGHVLAWLGYPVARRLQKQFASDSKQAMRQAVAG